ncbi:Hypothetical predicted protein [Octopus vulgaris]|uniref:Uncharacterized protein n=1 Tax=Octopus vulgaris TaxID=6645 RepID=A0AA36APW9_OCTVU|nr:Hypothetical predicted protein [Octopus vulgaris]
MSETSPWLNFSQLTIRHCENILSNRINIQKLYNSINLVIVIATHTIDLFCDAFTEYPTWKETLEEVSTVFQVSDIQPLEHLRSSVVGEALL